ncbi:hypothetical protein G6F63_016693 [Rhizopus arrhizus]|nr:hypothetical protein G6F63_016693 [Rhizopus arrhizus]
MPPKALATCFTALLQNRGSRTSPAITTQRPPSRSTCWRVISASSASSRCSTATSAPSRANSTATARPIPESPPVMIARRPCSLPLPT